MNPAMCITEFPPCLDRHLKDEECGLCDQPHEVFRPEDDDGSGTEIGTEEEATESEESGDDREHDADSENGEIIDKSEEDRED